MIIKTKIQELWFNFVTEKSLNISIKYCINIRRVKYFVKKVMTPLYLLLISQQVNVHLNLIFSLIFVQNTTLNCSIH
jgi:hypothetical protein